VVWFPVHAVSFEATVVLGRPDFEWRVVGVRRVLREKCLDGNHFCRLWPLWSNIDLRQHNVCVYRPITSIIKLAIFHYFGAVPETKICIQFTIFGFWNIANLTKFTLVGIAEESILASNFFRTSIMQATRVSIDDNLAWLKCMSRKASHRQAPRELHAGRKKLRPEEAP